MIPFNSPTTTKNIEKCEKLLSELLETKVLLTPSCTSALEMTALLLDIQPGDEVIMPSFTFPSTANAFMLRGAMPVFCDIRPDTLNIDEVLISKLITKKTKAIVPVHYAGIACEMDTILNYDLPIVEDNAHGLFGTYQNKQLGTMGTFGTLSFHHTKNFSCGEGGALLINDPEYLPRAEVLREKGTNRQLFLRGEISKYTWIDLGSSYTMADTLAWILLSQINTQNIQMTRRELFWTYWDYLDTWAKVRGVQLPTLIKDSKPAYHIFWMVLPTIEDRIELQLYLQKRGVQSTTHFEPLHLSRMNKQSSHCPVTEDISQRLLRLPLHHSLSSVNQKKIIEAILEYS